MSWSISELVNTVKISKKCADELFDSQARLFCVLCDKPMADPLPGEEKDTWYYCYEKSHESQASKSGDLWQERKEVTYNGKLAFNIDHMEHMDYLAGEDNELTAILRKHKVRGDICFGSLEGDNAGEFWGYRFDGEGGMKELFGELEWYVDGTKTSGN